MSTGYSERLGNITDYYVSSQRASIQQNEILRAQKKEEARQAAAKQKEAAETAMRARIDAEKRKSSAATQSALSRVQNYGGVNYTGSSKAAVSAFKGSETKANLKGMKPGTNLTTIRTKAGRVTVNKRYAMQFTGFLNELAGIYRVTSLGGYNYRQKRGGSDLSMHAYGAAIDINPAQNPMQKGLKTNMPPNIASIAAKYGLQWGGSWRTTKDPMHFQAVWE